MKTLVAVAIAACSGEPGAARELGPTAPAVEHVLPVLPGSIWFVEEREPPILVKIESGQRTDIGSDLSALPARDPRPASPDGARIAFVDVRDGEQRIWLAARDGTNPRRLTDRSGLRFRESQPTWSPDGALVAYVVERGKRWHVWIRDVAVGREHDITPEGIVDSEPSFSPDGRWIVVSRTQGHDIDLWAIPTTIGDQPVRLTTARHPDRRPVWR